VNGLWLSQPESGRDACSIDEVFGVNFLDH